jgi:hypothetical protein
MADDLQLPGTGSKVAAKDRGDGTFVQEVTLVDSSGNASINGASDENLVLLRRIAKTLECLLITDNNQRQRVAIDTTVALPANQSVNVAQVAGTAQVVNIGVATAGSPRVTIAIDSLPDEKTAMMRDAYNNGIRRNLVFS